MDTHKCGDCQKEFISYENFIIHKLLIEQYKLTFESSGRIPTLRLPKFVKINQISKIDYGTNANSVSKSPVSTPGEKSEAENPEDPSVSQEPLPTETPCSPVVEVVVDSTNSEEVVSDDDVSVGSQAETLRIDESRTKETSSPLLDSSTELEKDQKKESYCKPCNRYYKNNVVLKVHQETVHSSTRPHVCSTCRQGFKTKGSLVRHTRTHTGERPFHCGQCQRGFLDSGTLARHVHRLHRKRPFKQANDMKVVITRLMVMESQDVKMEPAKS